ncbi:MAG: hypothetical protein OXI88_22540 [Gammaproteobacteria bacterium]|nr:hypothetical protein [Gammaproteobacteria bacterium]
MNINPDHLSQALRQIGVIVAATGLITGVFDVTQAGAATAITVTGMILIWIGALED